MGEISKEAFAQFESIRRSGLTNMLLASNVKEIAKTHGFEELEQELENGNYAKILEEYDKDKFEEEDVIKI